MATYQHGMFVWRELMTSDAEAALRFYTELFGWKAKAVPLPGNTYYLLHVGDKQVGGVMKMAADMTMPPAWSSYVSVPNVDDACAKAKADGGQVVWGPVDMENVGRMAGLVDAQGAVLFVMKGVHGDMPYATPKPGEFCWEQLNTTDVAAAKKFYGDVCGWNTKAMEGAPGTEVFGIGTLGQGEQTATLMQGPPGVPAHWLTYVVVDKLAPARERATRLGGKVMIEKIDVPKIGSFAVLQDPQGATLCIFESAF